MISIDDKNYPELLKKIGKSAPKQLYFKGDLSILNGNCLAVVGSRRMTTYGKQVAERIVGELSSAGITIVSGFMYGIDAEAHKAALRVGGRTIAVMPCGIDLISPEHQQDLYAEILRNNGLIVSEYEKDMPPALWTYPKRNRIVAGLSKAVLVVEAAEKSGSLITAEYARKFKRKIFVVPGPITSENSKGIMQLIKEGATPINSAQDILNYYQIKNDEGRTCINKNDEGRTSLNGMTEQEKEIIGQLQIEALDIDTIARNIGISAAKVGTTLSMMQLKNKIKQEGNKYYLC